MAAPTLKEILQAAERIKPYAHRTPLFTCASLDRQVGARVFLKCENLQKVGAFKFRGACNAVLSLPESEVARGVVTHSSGNHAQALALAARLRGIQAYIVMPHNALVVKKEAVAGYGGKITFCEPTLEARESMQAQMIAQTGATAVDPYNNYQVIAGQGTAALELLQDVPDLHAIIAPVGGGGLLSGTAIAATELSPGIRVIGAEPEGADDAFRSLAAGKLIQSVSPQTIADGLRTSLGDLTFPIIQKRVEQIVTVSEAGIVAAMKFVWERAKIIIEPSAAVAVGALWELKIDLAGLRVGVILSGGNVDLDRLPWQSDQSSCHTDSSSFESEFVSEEMTDLRRRISGGPLFRQENRLPDLPQKTPYHLLGPTRLKGSRCHTRGNKQEAASRHSRESGNDGRDSSRQANATKQSRFCTL